jgi:GntR family transcriptional regulator
LFDIDKYSRRPIYEQVVAQAERLIATGALEAGAVLPSVRTLSQQLSINPNTLQKAYGELERRGLCYSVPGSGRFITENAREIVVGQKQALLEEIERICTELREAGVEKAKAIAAVNAAYGKEDCE